MRTKRKTFKRKGLRRKSFKRKTLKRKTLKKKNGGDMFSLRCDKIGNDSEIIESIGSHDFLDHIKRFGSRTQYQVAIEKKDVSGRSTVWKSFSDILNLKKEVDSKYMNAGGTLPISPKLTKTYLYHTIKGKWIKDVCRKRFNEINDFMEWCNSSKSIKAYVKDKWFSGGKPKKKSTSRGKKKEKEGKEKSPPV